MYQKVERTQKKSLIGIRRRSMTIEKIIITGDFLRQPDTDLHNCRVINNINIFSILFKDIFKEITDLPVEICFDSLNKLREDIYIGHNFSVPLKYDYWQKIFYNNEIKPEIQNKILKYFKNSLIIGIEIPEILCNYFDSLNIPYIDFIIHPIRYMDDLALGLRTNNLNIYKKLIKYQINIDYFKLQATYLKIAYNSRRTTNTIHPNSCVIFGQTHEDISILKPDKTFANILDYKDRITEFANKYDHIYLKPHPYNSNYADVIEFLNSFKNKFSILNNANPYDLYSNNNVELCTALSSGSLYEAKYFGKKIEYLYKQPFKHGEDYIEKSLNEYNYKEIFITVYKYFLKYTFWISILSDIIDIKEKKEDIDIDLPNIFRYAAQGIWSFDDNKSVTCERRLNNLEKRLKGNILNRILYKK